MADSVRGIQVGGAEPKELKLSDGSRLWLETEPVRRGRVAWRRADEADRVDGSPVAVHQAMELAGEDFESYVAVRTRAEAEWLRAVADWYRDQADELGRQLSSVTR